MKLSIAASPSPRRVPTARLSRRPALACAAACAWLLAGCGGAGDGTPPAGGGAAPAAPALERLALPADVAGSADLRLDPRLHGRRGPVEVWVVLDQPAAAVAATRRATELGVAEGAGLRALRAAAAQARAAGPRAAAQPVPSRATLESVQAAARQQRQRVQAQQASLAARMQTLGGRELGRVSVAHNAIAVSVDASALPRLAALPGVLRVRPVQHHHTALAASVPYVGALASPVQAFDGRGVTVAVLDSGIDYTHRHLGGPGTAAAYEAAYGSDASGALAARRDGLFPTAKVVGGHDFVGEQWPEGPRSEDDDPIARRTTGGHGTHVADIIAGADAAGTHRGMAPGASLLAVKVCSAVAGACDGVALLRGVDYALDPDGDGDPTDAADVMNLSLGSNFGQPEDELSAALGWAVRLGVVVVAAGGNGGNQATITASPASEPGVISVAQTEVPGAVSAPLVIEPPSALAGTYHKTAALAWAPVVEPVTGAVVALGRGCPADAAAGLVQADPYPQDPAGRIVLVERGGCDISLKVERAAQAGARGVLLALPGGAEAVGFSQGGGTRFVPALVLGGTLSTALKRELQLGGELRATLGGARGLPLAGSVVSTSARGPSNQLHRIKPEIGAPGASVSAVAGSGTGVAAFGGTSGAAPMVAGAAALLLQAHPTRSPAQIKAMLMNTAHRGVQAGEGAPAPVSRIGAGELRVDRALAADVVVWNPRQSSAALSFGYRDVSQFSTALEWLQVENLGTSTQELRVAVAFRDPAKAADGAVTLNLPDTVSVPPGERVMLPVTLLVDAAKLPDWEVDGADLAAAGDRLAANEYDGYITFSGAGGEWAVPWHVLPRRATAVLAYGLGVGQPLQVFNAGLADAAAEVFALTGTSDWNPLAGVLDAGTGVARTDLQAAGVRLAAPGVVQFAVASFGRRTNPLVPAALVVEVDGNRDGVPDHAVFNTEHSPGSGLVVVAVHDYATGTAQAYYRLDAELCSGSAILTVPLAALGLREDAPFDFQVTAYDNYFSGLATDRIGPMTFTLSRPRFGTAALTQAVPAGGRANIETSVTEGGAEASPSQSGLLLLYRGNAGQDAGLVPLLP